MSNDTRMGGIANFLARTTVMPGREDWNGSQYALMIDMCGAAKSYLGRQIIKQWLRHVGFEAEEMADDDVRGKRRPGLSALVLSRNRLALCKMSMKRANGTVLFQHLSTNEDHAWDGALLLGLDPNKGYIWYVPRRILMAHTATQHSPESRCLAFRLDAIPDWLHPYGGRLDWAVSQWTQRKGLDDAV